VLFRGCVYLLINPVLHSIWEKNFENFKNLLKTLLTLFAQLELRVLTSNPIMLQPPKSQLTIEVLIAHLEELKCIFSCPLFNMQETALQKANDLILENVESLK
jgi:hypothetical protein